MSASEYPSSTGHSRRCARVRIPTANRHGPTPTLIGTADGWDWWEADVVVVNPRHGYRWMFHHEDGRVHWLNQSGLHTLETLDAEDFALVAFPAPPAWMYDAVLYQVFPDRFARSAQADDHATPDWAIAASWDDPVDVVAPGRSQQFYGGDLDGVTGKLDHLVELGVNLLYLTPVFPARVEPPLRRVELPLGRPAARR